MGGLYLLGVLFSLIMGTKLSCAVGVTIFYSVLTIVIGATYWSKSDNANELPEFNVFIGLMIILAWLVQGIIWCAWHVHIS